MNGKEGICLSPHPVPCGSSGGPKDVVLVLVATPVLVGGGYLGDKVGILELLVELPDPDAASHVGAGNLPNRVLLFTFRT